MIKLFIRIFNYTKKIIANELSTSFYSNRDIELSLHVTKKIQRHLILKKTGHFDPNYVQPISLKSSLIEQRPISTKKKKRAQLIIRNFDQVAKKVKVTGRIDPAEVGEANFPRKEKRY